MSETTNIEYKTVLKLTGDIDTETLSMFLDDTDKIMDAYGEYLKSVSMIKDKYINPFDRIIIEISSYGGCTDCGSAIIDRMIQMQDMGLHVDTHCLGMAYSMAFVIYICGEIRTSGKMAKFMNHGSSGRLYGYVDSMNQDIDFMKKTDEQFDKLILQQTLMTEERINTAHLKCDWIMYDEAVELGIINEYEGKPTSLQEEADTLNIALDVALDVFSQMIEEEDKDVALEILANGLVKYLGLEVTNSKESTEKTKSDKFVEDCDSCRNFLIECDNCTKKVECFKSMLDDLNDCREDLNESCDECEYREDCDLQLTYLLKGLEDEGFKHESCLKDDFDIKEEEIIEDGEE